ncbi:MAG: hypothetical protein LUH41_00395 [Clostridiales bacterium]|nr:hypothetical protein [Clostridiales bacterium]
MRDFDTGACIQKSALLNGQEGKENQSRRTGVAAEEKPFPGWKKAAKPHRPIFPKKRNAFTRAKNQKDDI